MQIRIELFSEWQCGSGLSSGSDVDLLAIKDSHGFPFIPGRTLKGLLADAASQLERVAGDSQGDWNEFRKVCFGRESSRSDGGSESGCLFVSNAELGGATRQEIKAAALAAHLFRKRSGTKIDDQGQAEEHTLRRMEVAVPMSLYGSIEGCPPPYLDHLEKCMMWVKQLGSQRHRGMGRCHITIEEKA